MSPVMTPTTSPLRTELGFDGGKARIDLDAKRFGLLREPAAELAQADDVVAVIAHQRRHDEVAERGRRPTSSDNRSGRRATSVDTGAPSAFQSGISSLSAIGSMTAPERICAPTSEPFSMTQTDDLAAGGLRELFQADRGGEPGRPCAHDHDVELHALARVAHGRRLCVARICTVNGDANANWTAA